MAEPQTLDELARAEVLQQLALSHDHYVATERRAYRTGDEVEAEGAHRVATWLVRAYAVERDDPKPENLP